MNTLIPDLDVQTLMALLAPRPADCHKGDFGHSLLIGGNHGFFGAIIMASIAAARVGSGLTSVATQINHAPYIPLRHPEIMAHGVRNAAELKPLHHKASVIAIGPGLGQDAWAQELFNDILTSTLPLILDADALRLLASTPSKNECWILTPHAGEAAALLRITVQDVLSDRVAAITELQTTYGGVIILKGHHTLIASDNKLVKCSAGNPGMATGGMGDVLTGVITGLVAQKIPLEQAAQLGAYLHSKAADLAAEQEGERGLMATDLLMYLRRLVNPAR
jgi:hydroxyethylthiazole kinase-like uncharacterized protein yjeF